MEAWKHLPKKDCPHLSELHEDITSAETVCHVCDQKEDLRICLTCGYVSCCESHAAHDTAHFKETGHPFIRPQNSKYQFLWCYKCNAFLD